MSELFEEEYRQSPPPRKDDVLIRADQEHPLLNACLNYMHGSSSDHGYREGYRIAAKILAEKVCETANEQDTLVYPIVHNYRHHVELVLKRLLVIGLFVVGQDLTDQEQKLLGKHRLDLLWAAVKPLIYAVAKDAGWSKPETADIEGIDSYIRQLTEVDPDSYSFRYATSKKGDPSVPGVKYLNIYVFASHMEQLADYLSGIDTAFDMLKEQKNEYLAEMWRAYGQ